MELKACIVPGAEGAYEVRSPLSQSTPRTDRKCHGLCLEIFSELGAFLSDLCGGTLIGAQNRAVDA